MIQALAERNETWDGFSGSLSADGLKIYTTLNGPIKRESTYLTPTEDGD